MRDTTPSRPPRQPSSLACVPCRRRHLRCDAQMPVCSRCLATETECHYIRSRRGLRSNTANPPSHLLDENILLLPDINPDASFPEWLSASSLGPDLDTGQTLFQPLDTLQTIDIPALTEDALTWPQPENAVTPNVAYDPMIQLYYQGFHRSHPILISRKSLHSPLCQSIPTGILSIMRYIGAHHHADPTFKEIFRPSAYSVLSDPSLCDRFKVQAMLLLAIVDHAHGQEDTAYQLLQAAINLALELGMNRVAFAAENSEGSPVLAESWRRTYWELYVVDGFLAAMRDQSSFRLYRQGADVRLPCDEEIYSSGDAIIPTNQTLEDFQNNWSLGHEETRFSSFAYRINAVRILGTVLELNQSLEIDLRARIEIIDACLMTSLMHLPPSQSETYDSTSLDEMAFQAQMACYLGMIHLHRPRSNMRFASFNAQTSCTRLKAASESNISPAELDLHSHKLLRAADILSNLATLPSPVKYRTPFFTCALAMCVVVHTAACLTTSSSERQESLKARIQLGVGALNVLGKVWPLAGTVRHRLVNMYQEVGLRSR